MPARAVAIACIWLIQAGRTKSGDECSPLPTNFCVRVKSGNTVAIAFRYFVPVHLSNIPFLLF